MGAAVEGGRGTRGQRWREGRGRRQSVGGGGRAEAEGAVADGQREGRGIGILDF